MTTPLYSNNSLVEYSDRIYQILETQEINGRYQYKLKLKAFLTKEAISIEYMHQSMLSEIIVEEQKLKKFTHNSPRYEFDERVRWTDSSRETCYAIVKFILFENHRYMYRLLDESRKDEGYWMNYGHLIEESYISK